jgi:hypothetical protein
VDDSAAPSADTDLDPERACTGPGPPGREELEEEVDVDVDVDVDEVGEETEDSYEDEEGAWAAVAAFFAAAFFPFVGDAAGATPGGMETPTRTTFLPAAAAARLFLLFFFLVVVGPLRSAMAPLNDSAAIPSAAIAIALSSSDDVRVLLSRSDDEPEPATPEVVVGVVPAGVGVASMRGTST